MIESMPRVTTNELMPRPSVSPALISPTIAPTASAKSSPSTRLSCRLSSCIAITPMNACIDPTERSTSRAMMSIVIPIAVIATRETVLSSVPMFRFVQKTSDSDAR